MRASGICTELAWRKVDHRTVVSSCGYLVEVNSFNGRSRVYPTAPNGEELASQPTICAAKRACQEHANGN
jgi:hypothetical protein